VIVAQRGLEAHEPAERRQHREDRPPRQQRARPMCPQPDRVGLDRGVGDAIEDAGRDRARCGSRWDREHRGRGQRDQGCADQDAAVQAAVGAVKSDRQGEQSDRHPEHRKQLAAGHAVAEDPRGERHGDRQAAGGECLNHRQRRNRDGDDLGDEADPAERLACEP
jgi:hypothetical protein